MGSIATRRRSCPSWWSPARLPWPVFAVGWMAMLVGIYIWMAGDDRWPLLVFVPVLFEFYLGNIHLLLALAVVLGFRWPGAWAFVLLTKITPGIGLWWFVVRREWRSLGIALGVTAAIVMAGILVSPGVWREWYVSLTVTGPATGSNQIPIPLPSPPACGVPAGDLGRPHRPPLDGRRRHHPGPADPLVPWPGDARGHRGPATRAAGTPGRLHRAIHPSPGCRRPGPPAGPRRSLTQPSGRCAGSMHADESRHRPPRAGIGRRRTSRRAHPWSVRGWAGTARRARCWSVSAAWTRWVSTSASTASRSGPSSRPPRSGRSTWRSG